MTRQFQLETRNSKLERLVPLLLGWFRENARDLPWRRTRDPYAIWISEIMLQQTQVKTVIPYWERWMRELPDIESLARASADKIHKLWEGLGYYTRVRNLQKAAQQIVAQSEVVPESGRRRGNESQTKIGNPILRSGATEGRRQSAIGNSETPHVVSCKFPGQYDDVLALPGVGRYTAGAICSIAFNQPAPILDGNVIRVLTRVFGIAGNPREKKTNERLWQLAGELVHHASRATFHAVSSRTRTRTRTRTKDEQTFACSSFNQSLMELGALICTPRAPQCSACPIRKHCAALREDRIAELPNLGKRVNATERRFAAFVVERQGKFLVRQRPAGVVNAQLWEFPNVECAGGSFDPRALARTVLGGVPESVTPLCTVKHSITRFRITLDAFLANGLSAAGRARTNGRWLDANELEKRSFPSAHRTVLAHLRRWLARRV